MANPPRKKSWRDAIGSPAPSTRGVDETWRQQPAEAPKGTPWWRKRWARLGMVAGGMGVVALTIFILILLLRAPRPFVLVLVGAGYEENLAVPHNAPGAKSLEALEVWADRYNEQTKGKKFRVSLEGNDFGKLTQPLEVGVLERAPKKLIMIVSAQGVAKTDDGKPTPYLIPNDYHGGPDAHLFPLDTLLDALAKLENTEKLLILDCTQVAVDWPLGILHNDFARALDARAERIKSIPKLVVIGSSAADQRSWGAPEWKQTAFLHYILEGLQGAADGKGGGSKNDRVDAFELYTYAHDQVRQWARNNRARPQTPVLLPSDEKRARGMELVSALSARAAGESLGKSEGQEETKANEERSSKATERLSKAWGRCSILRGESPHPAAYTPHLWRRYLDTLVRAEQLLRWGQQERAENLLTQAEGVEADILKERSLKNLESIGLTLAMPAALGLRLTPADEEGLKKAVALWDEPGRKPEDCEKALRQLLEKRESQSQALLRTAAAGKVLSWIAAQPKARFQEGWAYLEALEDPLPSWARPAESHFLVMLRPDLKKPDRGAGSQVLEAGQWDLLKEALEVRILAEQAALGLGEGEARGLHAYSEQVSPWLVPSITQGDEDRQKAEDLLVVSDPQKTWSHAKNWLAEARKSYVKAQQDALAVRRALYQRDRALSELPYFTRWAAAQSPRSEQPLAQLWAEVHRLRAQLEKPLAMPADALQKLAGQIDQQFQEIETTFRESALKGNAASNTPARWREIEAALWVPFLKAQERETLREASHRIAEDLARAGDKAAGVEEVNAGEVARRQGHLALATLGVPGVEDPAHEDFKKAEGLVRDSDETSWPRSLLRAGEFVGKSINRLPEEANLLAEKASHDDLKTAAPELFAAAQAARQVEGSAVGPPRMKSDPVGARRRLLLHDLLCWQARRAYLDFWAERAGKPFYFQKAGTAFLSDAALLVDDKGGPKRTERLKVVTQLRAALDNAEPPVVEWSFNGDSSDFHPGKARISLTDEKQVERYYRLKPPRAEGVRGEAVRWIDVSAPTAGTVLATAPRQVESFNTIFPAMIVEGGAGAGGAQGRWDHAVHGYFRGHESAAVTEVLAFPKPELTWSELPLPNAGRVAVQAERSLYDYYGARNTAVEIVLDCTGSMNDVKPGTKERRWDKAVNALSSVLEKLPNEVVVSLRVFGAKEFDRADDLPELGGHRLVWGPGAWEQGSEEELIGKVKRLTPYGETALARAMAMAANDVKGPFKAHTMVVITDGVDNLFAGPLGTDRELNPGGKLTMRQFLERKFGNADTQVHVICYETELTEAEKPSFEDFKKAIKAIKGQFYEAKDSDSLRNFLRRSLLYMYFRIYPVLGGDPTGVPDDGRSISRSDVPEVPNWIALQARPYLLRVPSIRRLENEIAIAPGDSLLLDLVPGVDGPMLQRAVYAKSRILNHTTHKVVTAPQQKEWLLAALENHRVEGARSVQIKATLEKEVSGPTKVIQQVRPEWSWFEVAAPADATGTHHVLHVRRLHDYPAPAWSLHLPRWPDETPTNLQAWWLQDLPRPAHGRLHKVTDFKSLADLAKGRPWPTTSDQGQVTLLGAKVETARLETQQGRIREVTGLVVRLKYPPAGGPYFVRLPGWDRAVEHRFYLEAGMYTGIFWNMTKEEAESLEDLELYSIAALKAKGYKVDKLDLGIPNQAFAHPDPVWE
jgi:hypothetical protein